MNLLIVSVLLWIQPLHAGTKIYDDRDVIRTVKTKTTINLNPKHGKIFAIKKISHTQVTAKGTTPVVHDESEQIIVGKGKTKKTTTTLFGANDLTTYTDHGLKDGTKLRTKTSTGYDPKTGDTYETSQKMKSSVKDYGGVSIERKSNDRNGTSSLIVEEQKNGFGNENGVIKNADGSTDVYNKKTLGDETLSQSNHKFPPIKEHDR